MTSVVKLDIPMCQMDVLYASNHGNAGMEYSLSWMNEYSWPCSFWLNRRMPLTCLSYKAMQIYSADWVQYLFLSSSLFTQALLSWTHSTMLITRSLCIAARCSSILRSRIVPLHKGVPRHIRLYTLPTTPRLLPPASSSNDTIAMPP